MTKTEILAEVRARTGRKTAVVDIDDELNGVLKNITTKFDFLKHYKTVTLTAGDDTYDIEDDLAITDLKEILEIRNSDGDIVTKADNRQAFLDEKASEASGNPPTLWWIADKRETASMTKELMIAPTPSEVDTITIYHSFYHPTVSGTEVILLTDIFKECVIEGVCYEVYKGLGIPEKGLGHKNEYEEKLNIIISAQPQESYKVVYRDI